MSIARQLRGDEGERPCAYQDHLGFWTIGIGRLIDDRKPGSGLRPDEIEYLFANDVRERVKALAERIAWFSRLDEARQGVLLNMSFQMGVDGLLKFTNTLALVERGEYAQAASNMLKSLWAQQTPARATRLAKQMNTGVWQYAPGA